MILLCQLILPILVLLFTILVILHLRISRLRRVMWKLPGPRCLPFFGSSLELNVSNKKMSILPFEFTKKYGPRYVLQVGNIYYLNLTNGEDIEKVLASSVHVTKGENYNLLMPWLGEGLLTSKPRKWHSRRKILTPTFHFKILEDFMPIFNEQSKVLVEIIKKEFSGGQVRDMYPYVTRCALDIISETAMGTKLNSQNHRDTPYVKAVYKMCEFVQYRLLRPWYNYEFLWRLTRLGREEQRCLKILHEFTTRVIKERKRESSSLQNNSFCIELNRAIRTGEQTQVTQHAEDPKERSDRTDDTCAYWKGKRRLAFLDLLIEAQKNPENNLSDADLREEVDTFMFEGHDTTAASLNWTLFLLGTYKEHQVKVQQELDEIFGDDKNRSVTSSDLTRMKYLELCIKESLRLYPSVPFIARYLNTECVLDQDTTIPAGVNVFIMTGVTQRNEKVFPEPKKFWPERFLPENSVGRHPFSYIPFSAGPRNCIGQKFALMEEKVILSTILRNFTVEAAQKLEDVIVMTEVITRPRNGHPVRFLPRS